MKVNTYGRKFRHLDWYLIINGLALFAIGIMNLFSATSSFSSGSPNFVLKQLIAFLAGIIAIRIISHFDYRSIAQRSRLLYWVLVGLIFAVFLYGTAIGGSKRWIILWGISFQPSELMKPILVLCLAHILRIFKEENRRLTPKDTLKPLLYTLMPVGLIIMQPDLGTGMITLLVSFSMLWFVGMEKKVYAIFLGAATVLVLTAKYILKPYQLERIYIYLNSLFGANVDPSGAGYQIRQSTIAISSGKLFGKGYMAGTQHKLMFVPEHHTDFIFTVFAEEWGFFGSMILFLLFISFIARCIKISQNSNDAVGSLMAFGMTSIIFFQFVINVLMTMKIAPVVGIPLPFISYGGSSLLSVLVSVGILLNVSMRRYMF